MRGKILGQQNSHGHKCTPSHCSGKLGEIMFRLSKSCINQLPPPPLFFRSPIRENFPSIPKFVSLQVLDFFFDFRHPATSEAVSLAHKKKRVRKATHLPTYLPSYPAHRATNQSKIHEILLVLFRSISWLAFLSTEK